MHSDKAVQQAAASLQGRLPLPRPAQPHEASQLPGALSDALRGLLSDGNGAGRDAEAALHFFFSRLYACMHEGFVLFGAAGEIAYVNANLCRTLRHRRAALIGLPARNVFGDVLDRASRAKAAAGTPLASTTYEARFERRGGSAIVAQVSAHRLAVEGGRDICFALLSDVTERVKAEAELREARSDLRLLSAQLLAAEELERKRIGRELHDGLGQSLGGIKYGLEGCSQLLAAGETAAAARQVRQLVDGIKRAVEDLRRISMNLRPAVLEGLGTLASVSWFVREFRLLHRALKLETNIDVRETEIPTQAKPALHRIVQEALNNTASHARASSIWLALVRAGDCVVLSVRDDGIGFDPADFATVDAAGRGIGLASMRERAEASGGRFVVDSKPGHGTQILVRWACNHAGDASDWRAGGQRKGRASC